MARKTKNLEFKQLGSALRSLKKAVRSEEQAENPSELFLNDLEALRQNYLTKLEASAIKQA